MNELFEIKDEADIKALINRMDLIFNLINLLPLDQYIEKANHAMTIGPFIDPTLFMKASRNQEFLIKKTKILQNARNDYKKLEEDFVGGK